MKAITIENQKALLKAVANVQEAEQKANAMRPTIKALEAEILAKHNFQNTDEAIELNDGEVLPVNCTDDLWLVSESNMNTFTNEAHAAYTKAGYTVKFGLSPLLCVESDIRDLKTEVVKAACKMSGIDFEEIRFSAARIKKFYDRSLMLVQTINQKNL